VSTYEVGRQGEHSATRSTVAVPWMVAMRHAMPIRDLTEAEAHILAWALNAISNGRVLSSVAAPFNMGLVNRAVYDVYQGPIEGVAPPNADPFIGFIACWLDHGDGKHCRMPVGHEPMELEL